jgi:hypothetical protein
MNNLGQALQNPTVAAVHGFVASPAGQDYIRYALQRRRLPSALDVEIENAVLFEAARFVARGGEIHAAESWAKQRITARSIDLVRGAIRREAKHPEAPLDVDVVLAHTDLQVNEDPRTLFEVRRFVLEQDAASTDVSAALAFVAVVAEQAAIHADCPQPIAGATQQDAALWAGLWYAGRAECFGPGNTITKRRTRAAARVRDLLNRAAESAAERKS